MVRLVKITHSDPDRDQNPVVRAWLESVAAAMNTPERIAERHKMERDLMTYGMSVLSDGDRVVAIQRFVICPHPSDAREGFQKE